MVNEVLTFESTFAMGWKERKGMWKIKDLSENKQERCSTGPTKTASSQHDESSPAK